MKISIAMATYNGASYLREQLGSIKAQTRLPDELIVCDDQSTDDTVQILRDFANGSPFPVVVEVNEQRLGSTKNFEKAIGLCSGEIIALSDQDDVWMPHKLKTIERRFEQRSDLGLVFSNGKLIDQNGDDLPKDVWSRFRFGSGLQSLFGKRRRSIDLMLARFFMTGATMAFRSKFLNVVVPIPDGLPTFIHDRWIAVVIGALSRVDPIPDKLIGYRLHPRQQMGVGKRTILHDYFMPYACSSELRALTLMRERLFGMAAEAVDPTFVEALDTRRRHLAARQALPNSMLRRLPGVAREYFAGRYQRYSLGRAYAVKDLVVGTR